MSDDAKVKISHMSDACRITVDVGSGDYETRAAWRYNSDGTITLIAIRAVKVSAVARAPGEGG